MHQRLRHAGAASILRQLRLAVSARMRSRPRLSCPRTPLALVDGPLAALTRTRLHRVPLPEVAFAAQVLCAHLPLGPLLVRDSHI